MEVLSSEIVREFPIYALILISTASIVFVLLGGYWLYEIITKKEEFSFGAIVLTVIGLLFATFSIYEMFNVSYNEHVKATVTDWNKVYEEGWEVISQEGKIVELRRQVMNK